jgi:2-hydroxy-6-oxonona-2,4-dienedioate hydrolase
MPMISTTIWTELMGLELRQAYYNAGGIKTRVLEVGSGEPLVLIHGGGGHAETYAHNIPALAKHFKIYAIDLVGHGFTDAPKSEETTYDDLVQHIHDFQTAIGAEKISLSGMSISGVASGLYAGRYPTRVKRLVMNTGVPLTTDEAGTERYKRALAKSGSRPEGWTWTREAVRERLGGLFLNGVSDVPEELVDVRYKLYSQPGFAKGQNRVVNPLLREWMNPEGILAKSGENTLRKIECPTLILWTKKNPSQGVPVAERALSCLKKGKLVVLENSGHWPHWEEPENFNKAFLEFALSV